MNRFLILLIGLFGCLMAFVALVSLFLPLEDELEKADVIVVVSGGDTAGRTNHAVRLYQDGWAPRLVFAGAAKDPNSASNAKAMLAIAAAQGVPVEDILLEETSRDTRENAENTAKLIGDHRKIILVTSDYHQRGVFKEFQTAFDSNVQFINSPAKDKHWGRRTWFLTPYGWWVSVTEIVRLAL